MGAELSRYDRMRRFPTLQSRSLAGRLKQQAPGKHAAEDCMLVVSFFQSSESLPDLEKKRVTTLLPCTIQNGKIDGKRRTATQKRAFKLALGSGSGRGSDEKGKLVTQEASR